MHSALAFTVQAGVELTSDLLDPFKAMARIANAAETASAEAHAEYRAAEAHDRDQSEFDTHLRNASEHAAEARQLADLAIERQPE